MPTDGDVQALLRVVPDFWSPAKNPGIRYTPLAKRVFHRDRNYALTLGLLDSACRIGEMLTLKLVSNRKLRLLSILDELGFYWGYPRMVVCDGRGLLDQSGRSRSVEAIVCFAGCASLCSQRYAVMTSSAYNGPEFIASEIKTWLRESGSSPHDPNKTSYRSRLPVAEWVSRKFLRQGARRAAQSRTLCFRCPSPDTLGSASALVQ